MFAGKELKNWRVSQNVSGEALAVEIGVDPSTYYRYENDALKIPIDTMYRICEKLGNVSVWCDWMASEYPNSYGRVHPVPFKGGLLETVVNTYIEIGDMLKIREASIRDASNGVLENAENIKKMRTEICELSKALTKLNIEVMGVK